MPPLDLTSPSVAMIEAAFAKHRSRGDYRHPRLSASELGGECERRMWYAFRWASPPEDIDGRKHSIFETGEEWERRLVERLKLAGFTVQDSDPETGKQWRIVFASGHASGRTDGKISGIPEAPKTVHVLEIKSHNDKSFKDLMRHGVAKSKPQHMAQMQLYMHLQGLTRAYYIAVNKNDDSLYSERVEYDFQAGARLVARAEYIATTDYAPPRIHEDPEAKAAFVCRHMCPALPVCHQGVIPARTCRTCAHATAHLDGDARWSCSRWGKDLTLGEQAAGCPAHLYNPDFIPGQPVDASEASEWVEYQMKDGTTWRDGE